MSSVFDAVKAAIPVPTAAKRYGLEVNSGDMARCPFHDDRTPSMKRYEDHYFCFGCGKHGDVISLVAELFAIPPYDAACKLADDFGLPSPSGHPKGVPCAEGGTRSVTDEGRPIAANAREELRFFREDQLRCQRVLCAYLRLLTRWREEYALTNPEDEPDDRFVEACQMIDTIDYLTDLLIVGTLEQRVRVVDLLLADGKIDQLEERLKRLKEEHENAS